MDYTEDGKLKIIIQATPNTSGQKLSPELGKNFFKQKFLVRSETPPKFFKLEEPLPKVKLTPPEIFECPLSKVAKISVGQAFWQNGRWHVKSAEETPDEVVVRENNFFRGSTFIECGDGVYSLSREGLAGQRITNAIIRIVGLNRRIRADDTVEEFLTCAVGCSDAWGQREEEVEIGSNDFKTLFVLIRKRFRDVFVLQSRSDVLEEYLSAINQRDFSENAPKLRQKITAEVIGWSENDGKVSYRLGEGAFYADYNIPSVNHENRTQIFHRGFEFREVGRGNEIIEFLWLFAHSPYVLKIFREANAPITSVLFLKGRTNLLKTATASVLANVFNLNRSNIGIRLSSTQASIQHQISALRDNLILVDDFSNTAGSDNLKMTRNAEFLIRAIGDGRFGSKMNVADFSKLANDSIRVSVVLTGEEGLELDTSSLYRIVTLSVHENTFDGTVLARFQRDSAILRDYFALFIRYIEEQSQAFVSQLNQKFLLYRQEYAKMLRVPRFVDFASTMALLAELISDYARWCGCNENVSSAYFNSATSAVLKILELHQQESAESDTIRRFLFALNQSLETAVGTYIAEDKDLYVHNESAYIGFNESATQTIWLRFDEVFSLVKKFYFKLGQAWTVKEQTVKEELLRRGISEGTLMPKGSVGNEYLKRAKKGSRRRMLVLRVTELQKFS